MVKVHRENTTVSASRTISQIQEALAATGLVSKVMLEYEETKPVAVSFVGKWEGQEIPFRVSADVRGCFRLLTQDRRRAMTAAQERSWQAKAERVAWRVIYEWVKAQIALVEMGQAVLPKAFLGYAQTDGGAVLFDKVIERKLIQAPEGMRA